MSSIPQTIWNYSIWYIILGLISISLVITTSRKSANWKQTIAFYFSIVGITFFLEYPILVIFHGYSYYPMMMKEPFDDSMMGNLFSQTILSASALVIAINDLPFMWFIIFGTVFFLVEILFLKLGIYELHWYKSIFTLFGLQGYYWLIKNWYKKISSFPTKFEQHIVLFLSAFAIYSPCVEWILRLLGIYQFKIGIFTVPIRNHIFEYVIYISFVLNLITLIYKLNLNLRLKLLFSLGIYALNFILVKLNILYIKPNWLLIYSAVVIVINFLLVIVLDTMFGFRKVKS